MISVISILLLLFLVYFTGRKMGVSLQLLFGFLFKMICSFFFLKVYTLYFHHGSEQTDVIKFMSESKILNAVFYKNPTHYFQFLFGLENEQLIHKYLLETNHWSVGEIVIINDAKNVIRVNSLIYFLSRGNIWVHFAFFNAIYILSYAFFIQQFTRISQFSFTKLFWIGLLFLPSLTFWSASILKEPLLFSGLFICLGAIIMKEYLFKKGIIFILGAFFCLLFKPYVLFCFAPFFFLYVLVKNKKNGMLKWGIVSFALFILFVLIKNPISDKLVKHISRKQYDFINVGKGGMHIYKDSSFYYLTDKQMKSVILLPNKMIQLTRKLEVKKIQLGEMYPKKTVILNDTASRYLNYYRNPKAGSYIEITEIKNNRFQMVKMMPEALLNATLRPYFWDKAGKLKWINILESLFLISVLVYFFRRNRKNNSIENNNLKFLLIFTAISLLLLIGWTTPVIGAIVRYKIPAVFLILFAALIGENNKQIIEQKNE